MYRNGTSQEERKEGKWVISLDPQVAEGENVFGVCHIFAPFSDTSVRITDLSGQEAICCAAMLDSPNVAQRCKELGITALHIKLQGAQSTFRALEVTLTPSNSTHRKGWVTICEQDSSDYCVNKLP
ncbi:hypothetical protein FD755_001602 [Muntiacus reevesi]|uniref:Uncharacterized protein n=1 Tax=Muntiacus reevesi TaxID=9886 RepID=A0A5J5N2D4_MUNRE|nr:hypothetical protein FD755_001602 [Muntiacus reevesi]